MPLTDALKRRARELGFCAIGVTGAEPFREAETAAAGRTKEGLMDGLTWWSEARAAAARAGIGWLGKNTNLLVPGTGSQVLLCEIVTSAELDHDEPIKKSCGGCDACLRVCPTGALVAPGVLDNRRCISFWTIEHR